MWFKFLYEIMVVIWKMWISYYKYDFIMRLGFVVDNDFLEGILEFILDNKDFDGFWVFVSVDVMVGINDEDGWLLKLKLDKM